MVTDAGEFVVSFASSWYVVLLSKTECFPESEIKGQRSKNVIFKNETVFTYTYILNLSQEFALVWDFSEFSVLMPKLACKYLFQIFFENKNFRALLEHI